MAQTVVVVGGGVIGLATARALSMRGAAVVVLESGALAREASWAAAGILGVGSESPDDGPLFRLRLDAWRGWPGTAAALFEETGIDVGLAASGTLLVALDAAEAAALDARRAVLQSAAIPAARLDARAARAKEPALGPDLVAALWIGEGRLDNRRLLEAYEASCRARGVRIETGRGVERLSTRGDRVVGAIAGGKTFEADAVILASGAWSEALARTAGLSLPTVPIKGQMARLDAPDGFLSHVAKRGLPYAVPRAGRGVIVGTTSEIAGFDKGVGADAAAELVLAIRRFVPGLAAFPVVESWAGLRPRLSDGLPAIGPVRSRPGLFVATGHHRNGILLCEETGRLVAAAVFGEVDPRLAAFAPERFQP